jgi:predicted nucleotidyltransferase
MNAPLTAAEVAMMRGVFRRHPAIAEVRLFGSRAKGTHSFRSDVDLALFGAIAPLEGQTVAAELDDLPLAYKYDVQVFHAIQSKPLRARIHRVGLTLNPDVAPQFQASEGESTDAIEVLSHKAPIMLSCASVSPCGGAFRPPFSGWGGPAPSFGVRISKKTVTRILPDTSAIEYISRRLPLNVEPFGRKECDRDCVS